MRAVTARVNYMSDIRMSVWSESKELGKYYDQVTGR